MPGPLDLFLWLDASAARYWTCAWIAFACWLLAAVLPYRRDEGWRRWNPPVVFVTLMLLMLAAFRWPAIGQNYELENPDESQMVAGAITVLHTGSYWDVVDAGSAGPLNLLPLVLPRLVGLPVDYTGARSIGLLMFWGTCVFAWLTLRHAAGDALARWLVVPLACSLGFITHYPDFVQYTSEQAPLCYIALATWLVFTSFPVAGGAPRRGRLAAAGCLLGLLPLSKLQVAPVSVALGLWALAVIATRGAAPWRARLADAGCLVGGGFLGLAVGLGSIAASGHAADVYQTFWLRNLKYAQARDYPWIEAGRVLTRLSHLVFGFDYYFYSSLLLIFGGSCGWRWLSASARRHAVFGGLLFVTGLVVVLAPGRAFQHYLQLLVLPTSLCNGLLYAGLAEPVGFRRRVALGTVLVVGLGPQLWYRTHDWNPFVGHLAEGRARAVGAVARQILDYARPGDSMVVWGWMPTFHVQTQLPQGGHDAHAERQISPNPQRDYFRQRYFDDLERSRPAIFVDAVGEKNFGYHSRDADGHEHLPWLNDFIAANYRFVAEVETSRVYVRKDRWAEHQPGPAARHP